MWVRIFGTCMSWGVVGDRVSANVICQEEPLFGLLPIFDKLLPRSVHEKRDGWVVMRLSSTPEVSSDSMTEPSLSGPSPQRLRSQRFIGSEKPRATNSPSTPAKKTTA